MVNIKLVFKMQKNTHFKFLFSDKHQKKSLIDFSLLNVKCFSSLLEAKKNYLVS